MLSIQIIDYNLSYSYFLTVIAQFISHFERFWAILFIATVV